MLRVEGRIVNHDGASEGFDGAIEIDPRSGLIVHVGEAQGRSDVDTQGCLIFPGFGDVHVHARKDASGEHLYKEDFRSAGEAAIHGGVVHFADMPNKRRVNVDDHWIYVATIGSHEYAAWGGENDRDGFVQYRQRRAIELISGCRVKATTTKKTDDWTRASVKC